MEIFYILKNIRKIICNGRARIAFDAYKQIDGGHLFCGSFTAPPRTTKKNLTNFIPE